MLIRSIYVPHSTLFFSRGATLEIVRMFWEYTDLDRKQVPHKQPGNKSGTKNIVLRQQDRLILADAAPTPNTAETQL